MKKDDIALFFAVLVVLIAGPAHAGQSEPKTLPVATRPTGTVQPPSDPEAVVRSEIRERPSDAALHVRLGELLLQKGPLDEAMTEFDEGLKLNPRSAEAKTGRGIVLARKGSLKEAEAVLRDALILNPNPVRTHYELGLVYEKLGLPDKAITEFKEGIRKHEQGR